MIKQALGYGTLEQMMTCQEEAKTKLVDALLELLTPLLPSKQAIRRKLENTVGRAGDLANAMASEQALYQWHMYPPGCALDPTSMDLSNGDQNGCVSLCTFPWFGKEIMTDDGKTRTCLIKATVEPENVFEDINKTCA